jgi:hypothetical protein
MQQDLINLLDDDFERHPMLKAPAPGNHDEISRIESIIGFAIPTAYKEFILRYGSGIVGPYPIYGIGRAEAMPRNVTSALVATQRFHEQQWPGTEDWLIISTDHAGNPVGIDRDGGIWISDHDFGGVTKLFDTFDDYLRHSCLKLDSPAK